MTDTTQNSPAQRVDLTRPLAFLIRPKRVYEEMTSESRAAWSMPMIILSVTAIIAVIVAGYLKTQAAMMGEVPLPPDWQYWSPDMQQNFMQAQQATQGATFMYIIPLVGVLTSLWFGWVVVGGLLHLGSTLLGGRGSMQSALNVVAWASLPFALRDVLRVIFMISVGHAINSPSLSGFATTSTLLSQILSHVDLFWIWYLILLVIGFTVADGLSRKKASMGVAIVLLLVLAAQGGLGSLMARFGA